MTESTHDNPLLHRGGPPLFDRIEARHVVPAVREVLRRSEESFARLESELESRLSNGTGAGQNDGPSFEDVITPLEALDYDLRMTWGPVNHLLGVKNSEELREAHEQVLPEMVNFGLRMSQSEPLYRAFKHIRDNHGAELSPARGRIIEKRVLDAEHAGIGLAADKRARFNEIVNELSKLSTDFSNHVLDETRAFHLDLRDPAEVEGLPPSLRGLAAKNYALANASAGPADADRGPWRISLDLPVFFPFMQHSPRRQAREELYRAYVTRASSGKNDNTPLIQRILSLRGEMARMLGYESYAELSLAEKMAGDVNEVERLLHDLLLASSDAARGDLEELQAIARESGFTGELKQWDIAYYSERLREKKFDIKDEELRPYFPLPRVLAGLFALVERLFGVRVVEADGEVPVWHEDVRFFRVRDADGAPVAAFYLDPYSRPENKRGGAWMDECIVRRRDGAAIENPIAYLVCNGTPPVGDRPSLMTFREVETLFHEFGHGLQHMLTRVEEMDASGINGIEWDAVELPSQFMENWCYHKPTLLGLTSHVETGERLPDEIFEKLAGARAFRAGSDTMRQIRFAMVDLELHHRFDPAGKESLFEVQSRIEKLTSLLPPLEEDRFLCSFGHIFAGGYAAGYYSYKWAEVMSADAFGAFEEAGLNDEQKVGETGRRFRETVLALGGGRHPAEVFKDFRGRAPTPDALLRHSGLTKRSA